MKTSKRFYRNCNDTGRWKSFRIKIDTSDIYFRSKYDLSTRADTIVRSLREDILSHIDRQESFQYSFEPVERLEGCPEIVELMYAASEKAGVGPMAAVAGAVAQAAGRLLAENTEELIVENGGDIWMKVKSPALVSIYPGGHNFGGVAVKIYPERTPCGICTSSGRIGPSFSFGKADAATVISPDAVLSDAIATGVCNRVGKELDMQAAASYAIGCGASGVVIIFRDRMVVQGDVELADPFGEKIS
jgi:ApbE superfamily uncharacterized protein (UPF0280 family)